LTRARLALLVVAAVASLAAIAYAVLPPVLAGVVRQILAAQGFTEVRVQLGYPGLRTLRVRTVELAGSRAAHVFHFRARDIDIEYDIAELLEGRLIRVRVPDAALRLEPAPAAATAEAAQPTVVPLPGSWVAAFPLREVLVEKLVIDRRTGGAGAFTGHARAQVQRRESTLLAHLKLADEKHQLFELNLALTATGDLTATVLTPDAPAQPVLHVAATLVSRDAQTLASRGSIDAQLKPLLSLLRPWLPLPEPLAQLGGRLKASWSGDGPAVLPAQGGGELQPAKSNGTVSVDLSGVQLGKLLSDGRLHLDATLTSGGRAIRWRIADSFRISARIDPATLAVTKGEIDERVARNTQPVVLRAPRAISGELVVAPSEIKVTFAPKAELVLADLWTPEAHIAELRATLTEAARITYQPARGRLATTGVVLSLSAPAVEPMFAAIGTVENVAVTARIEPGPFTPLPPITVDEATVTLLGGRLRSHGVRYDVKSETNHFAIDLENFDVGRIVAMERQLGVEASGALDGRLPLSLTPRGVTIAGGRLRARPPGGVVRYIPNEAARAMAASNPSVKLVQEALSNYHYAKLEADVDYSETGDLGLRVAMAGQNPDWNAGQPINLNINLTDNIPMLLRSLRLADDISEQIEKRVLDRSKRKR
jgi:hypothetical protein